MTITVLTGYSTTPIDLVANDDQLWLLAGATLASTTTQAVTMTGGGTVAAIDGTIVSSAVGIQCNALYSNITVGATGIVRSTFQGGPAVYLNNNGSRLTNDGLIESVRDIGVYSGFVFAVIVNTGDIRAGLAGVYLTGAAPGAVLENHGTILGGVGNNGNDLAAGVQVIRASVIANHGMISSVSAGGHGISIGSLTVIDSAGGTVVTNHGTVSSLRDWGIFARDANGPTGIKVTNTGLISGETGSIWGAALPDTVRNAGTLSGDVRMDWGDDLLVNAGRIIGNVDMGLLNDTFNGRGGTVTGIVLGGDGNDLLIGGAGDDEMAGGLDNDTLRGGAGDDSLTGDAGDDVVQGWGGDDSLSGGTGDDALFGGQGDDSIAGDDDDDLLKGAQGDDVLSGGNGNDTLSGGTEADDLDGGALNDILDGGDGNDSVNGGNGNDVIEGGAGDDLLTGGSGTDDLSGGAGADILRSGANRDTLSGGDGADTFVFVSVADCGVGASRDVLTDFVSGIDRLDLSVIQAGMTFIGAAVFGNIAGQVRHVQATGLLSGDTNGDGTADFNLQLVAGAALQAGDFLF